VSPGAARSFPRRKLAFALVTLLLLFGVLELAARVLEWTTSPRFEGVPPPAPVAKDHRDAFMKRLTKLRKQEPRDIVMVDDAERGWALPKGLGSLPYFNDFSTNSLGLRGPEVKPRAPNEQRLFTMGDSSIFGAGVTLEHVFSSVAARELSRRWGKKVTAVIGATPGYDSMQSLITLRKLGAKVQPTWVIIVNLWSDLFHINANLVRLRRRTIIRGPLGHLALYRQLRRHLPGLRPIQIEWRVTDAERGEALGDRSMRTPIKHYAENLQQMVDAAQRVGARPLFLILPAPMDFSTDRYEPSTVEQFRSIIRKVAQQFRVPLVDGPALFRKAGAGLECFLDNTHPSARGHHILGLAVADALERAVREKGHEIR